MDFSTIHLESTLPAPSLDRMASGFQHPDGSTNIWGQRIHLNNGGSREDIANALGSPNPSAATDVSDMQIVDERHFSWMPQPQTRPAPQPSRDRYESTCKPMSQCTRSMDFASTVKINTLNLNMLPDAMTLDISQIYADIDDNEQQSIVATLSAPMQAEDFDRLFEDADNAQRGDASRYNEDIGTDASSIVSLSLSASAASFPAPTARREWSCQLEDLIAYKEEFGHCDVPSMCSEHRALGQWVKRQRYHFKLFRQGKPTSMTAERAARLEEMGFVWDSHAAQWEEKFRELRSYAERRGHCNVPRGCSEEPKLSVWVKRQRRVYAAGGMSAYRIGKLERLGFVWTTRVSRSKESKQKK